jgi:hypothetical protein
MVADCQHQRLDDIAVGAEQGVWVVTDAVGEIGDPVRSRPEPSQEVRSGAGFRPFKDLRTAAPEFANGISNGTESQIGRGWLYGKPWRGCFRTAHQADRGFRPRIRSR